MTWLASFTEYVFGLTRVKYADNKFTRGSDELRLPWSVRTTPDGKPIVPGFTAVQTNVAVPQFVSGNTSGSGGSNATIVQVLGADPERTCIEMTDTGIYDVELWYGARPPDSDVGQAVPRGWPLEAGGKMLRDTKITTSAIYATAKDGATGLVIVTGTG